jgi:hypothetical protein
MRRYVYSSSFMAPCSDPCQTSAEPSVASLVASTSALTVDDQAADSTDATDTTARRGTGPSRGRGNSREVYAQRIANDPKYTPRVGGFWTHDQRHYESGQVGEGYAGLRGMSDYWRGRGGMRSGFRGGSAAMPEEGWSWRKRKMARRRIIDWRWISSKPSWEGERLRAGKKPRMSSSLSRWLRRPRLPPPHRLRRRSRRPWQIPRCRLARYPPVRGNGVMKDSRRSKRASSSLPLEEVSGAEGEAEEHSSVRHEFTCALRLGLIVLQPDATSSLLRFDDPTCPRRQARPIAHLR